MIKTPYQNGGYKTKSNKAIPVVKITNKQKKFIDEYLNIGNATEAAMQAYKPKNRATARSIGSENLTKPNIRAYLEEKGANAAAMIYKLSQKAKNEAVRLNASRDILDRVGYFVNKATAIEINQKLPIPIFNITSPELSDKEKGEINRA